MKKILFLFAFIFLFVFISYLPAFSAYKPPTSDIIVFVDVEGGVRKDISEASKVPLFCLYKDGRLLYSTIGEDNLTFLMEVKLDENGIDRVKSFFSSFEEWNDIYDDCPLKDMPIVNITANIDGNVRTFSIRGIDYAMSQKTIPAKLTAFYRYAAFYSNDEAKEYESEEIYLYVKSAPTPDPNSIYRTIGWRVKINLESIIEDSGLSGVSSVKLTGKDAKRAIKCLKYFTPYMTGDLPVFVKQNGKYFSLAFRPLLPHELK